MSKGKMELKQIVDSLAAQEALFEQNVQRLENVFPIDKGMSLEVLQDKKQGLDIMHKDIMAQIITLRDIVQQMTDLENTLSNKNQMIKNILDDIKENKRFKLFLLSEFDVIGLIGINLAALFTTFTIGLSTMGLMDLLLFEIVYMSVFIAVRVVSKKSLNDILIENFIPEYTSFTKDYSTNEKQKEELTKVKKLANNWLKKLNQLDYRNYHLSLILSDMISSKELISFLGYVPVEILRRLKSLQEEAELFEPTIDDQQELPKVKKIGTMPDMPGI